MPTPEIPIDQQIQERPSEVFSETLNQAGVSSVPANPNPVHDDNGKPLISTQTTSSAKIQLPEDRNTLLQKAKGSINDAATWLANFWLRVMKKNADTNTTN